MARTIQFDYEAALKRATLLFWKKGFKNTSLKDLLYATKLGEGSFYNTMKSKKALYRACMDHYNQTVTKTRLDALLNASKVKIGIKNYFELILKGFENGKLPKSCLMANSLSADVLTDKNFHRYIAEGYLYFENIFFEQFEIAKQAGELPKSFDSRVTAELLVTFLQGLFRVSLATKKPSECRVQVEAFLKLVGL